MLINDTYFELKKIMKDQKVRTIDVARELKITPASVTNRMTRQVVNKGYIELLELLGYDIEIKYIKRDK